MYEISIAKHTRFTMPNLDFEGIPVGFDLEMIIETGIVPILAAGIGHEPPRKGFIGLGVCEAPRECFAQAHEAFRTRSES